MDHALLAQRLNRISRLPPAEGLRILHRELGVLKPLDPKDRL